MAANPDQVLAEVRAKMGTAEWAGITVDLVKGKLCFRQTQLQPDQQVRPFMVDLAWWEQPEGERMGMLASVLRQLGKPGLVRRGVLRA